MTKKGHRKISGGEWENLGWRMGNFRVENEKISGGETLLGVNVEKKVIRNLAYQEMLFYKISPVLMCAYGGAYVLLIILQCTFIYSYNHVRVIVDCTV